MKQLLLAFLLSIITQTVLSTSIPPPNVGLRVINNTNNTISKIVQIQSDTYSFQEIDTFAVTSEISNNKVRLFADRGKVTKKHHKLIIEFGDNRLESKQFEFIGNRQDFDLTINSDGIILSETNIFRRQKIISDLLVSILLILAIKGIVYTIGLYKYLRTIYLEFFIINLIYPITLYFLLNRWFNSGISYWGSSLILTLIIGTIEYIVYNIKLKFNNTFAVFISILVSSLLSVIVGWGVLLFVMTFF
ncbi:hypothetical protein [Carboxylicivirga sp. RSCT41]|uniref:hypothetical protein n=1 Tax=Carboxylicivirga agarovorans TaxID=3417570 RepID=UPI003D32A860